MVIGALLLPTWENYETGNRVDRYVGAVQRLNEFEILSGAPKPSVVTGTSAW
jgi:hypothetical protein